MIAWIKIAIRNLAKNLRRSTITVVAIALGFAAVNLFGGFTEYMYSGNREVSIFGNHGGHLSIFKKGFLERGQLEPAASLLSPKEIKTVEEVCRNISEVIYVTPQMRITGLLSNGKVSTIFVAQGVVPSSVDLFLSRTSLPELKNYTYDGRKLVDDNPYGAGLTYGLASLLDLKQNSSAVAFTTTIDGQMNALDLEVFYLFNTDSDEMNDKVMIVPLRFAQDLYDTKGADRLAVLLEKTEDTEPVRDKLQKIISDIGLDLEVKTWQEMSQWYRKVKDMFDVIFVFVFFIVFLIVVISVINTMSMAVIERTREIGTLRALGLKRKGVIKLFGIESALLGLLGTIAGLILSFLGWVAIDIFKPTWVPPNITARIPIRVEFTPEHMLYSFIFLMLLCIISSIIPARRAAKQNVVDALGHV